MTSPNRIPAAARTRRPDSGLRTALWVALALSAAANGAISIAGLGILPHLLSGLVCLACVVGLVVVHRRR